MARILLPTRWASQPQGNWGIDWSNPLTNGLKYAISANLPYELVTGQPLSYTAAPTRDQRQGGAALMGKVAAGNGVAYLAIPTSVFSGNQISIVYVGEVRQNFSTGGGINVALGLANTAGNQFFGLQPSGGVGGNTWTTRQTNGGATTVAVYGANAATVNTNDPKVLIGVLQNSSQIDVYWDGYQDNGSTTTGSSGSNAWNRVALGGLVRSSVLSTQEDTNGQLGLFFNRPYTPAEAFAISRNPWQIIRPLQRRIWVPVTSAAAYTLAADAGTFALTGQAAGLLAGRKITGGLGTFALTGQPAALLYGRKVAAGVGSFTLAGQDAAFRRGLRVPAAVGAFSLTGSDATLTYNGGAKILVAGAGAFSLTGNVAGLLVARKISAAAGSFALSGGAAGLNLGRMMAAGAGSFALAGNATSFAIGNRHLTAERGQFELSGQAANLVYSGAPAVQPQQPTGGYIHYPRQRTAQDVRDARVKFGVIPLQVKKAAKRVAKRVIAEHADPIEYFEDHRAQVEAQLRAELAKVAEPPQWTQAFGEQIDIVLQRLARERAQEQEEEELMLLLY